MSRIMVRYQHHGFRRYLRSHSDFDALVADLEREFRFVGDSGARRAADARAPSSRSAVTN